MIGININERLSSCAIGATPTFDPCKKCIVKVNCSEICDDRLRFIMALGKKRREETHKIRFNKKRRKNK